MKRSSFVKAGAFGGALMVFAAACTTSDVTDPIEPSAGLMGDALRLLPILQRQGPVDETSVTQVVGQAGGTVRLGGGELVVRIPSGALSSSTEITLFRPAGTDVKYNFYPHGLQFAKPVQIEIDLNDTVVERVLGLLLGLVAVYFENDESPRPHYIVPSELFDVTVTLDGRAVFWTRHFSGYCMAMD